MSECKDPRFSEATAEPKKSRRDERGGYWVQLHLSESQMAECVDMVAHLEKDPNATRFGGSVSRASAIRFALGVAVRALGLRGETGG